MTNLPAPAPAPALAGAGTPPVPAGLAALGIATPAVATPPAGVTEFSGIVDNHPSMQTAAPFPAPAAPPVPKEVPKSVLDYVSVVEGHFMNRPRNKQTKVGPSGLGHPCDRHLLASLAGMREPQKMNWKADIGTAMHAELEGAFEAANSSPARRWVTEQRVTVGQVGGVDITGSLDLYDEYTHTVMDHKLVGKNTLSKVRSSGQPPIVYRVQINLYALGVLLDGGWSRPEFVQICFLPREEEWSNRYIWHAPVDYLLAGQALERANGLALRLQQEGFDAAEARAPICNDQWCWRCAPLNQDARVSALTPLEQTFR